MPRGVEEDGVGGLCEVRRTVTEELTRFTGLLPFPGFAKFITRLAFLLFAWLRFLILSVLLFMRGGCVVYSAESLKTSNSEEDSFSVNS